MPYPQRDPRFTIVVTGKEKDVNEIREAIRLEILADPHPLSWKEFLFECYTKLGRE